MVIRAILFLYSTSFGCILVLSFARLGDQISWTPSNVAKHHFIQLLLDFHLHQWRSAVLSLLRLTISSTSAHTAVAARGTQPVTFCVA